jgi:hypothetical protein
VALVTVKTWRQPSFSHSPAVIGSSVVLLVAVIVLYVVLRPRIAQMPEWLDREGARAWLLGLQFGILLLTIPVLILVTSVAADREQWTWPFVNKRWLVALYFVAVATVVVWPVAFRAWLGDSRPQTSASPTASLAFQPLSLRSAAAALLLAWFFAGPPWNLDRHYRDIEYHEQVHLGPLQALAKGYLAYLGPASTQYGPGSQALIYTVMRQSPRFDLAAFRTAWAVMHFTAFIIVALVASWWLPTIPSAAVLLLAVAYSPLAFYGTRADGTLSGFFGWANALRYLAPLVVVPSLLRVAGTRRVVILGMAWGIGSWIAQENLSSTALSAGLLLLLLGLTRTISPGAVFRSARDLVLGFGLVAVPVVLYYAYHQAAGAFVENYFALPRAVAAGFQNTWWPPGDAPIRTFYTLPFVLVALAVLSLWRLPTMTLRTPLDAEAALLIAFVCVQLVCYPVALLRTDSAHLQNTTIALPFIVVLAVLHLPRRLGAATPRHAVAIRCVVVLIALAILPAGRLMKARELLLTPFTRFTSVNAPTPVDPRVSFARARPSDQPSAWDSDVVSRRSWLAFADDVRGLVGDRRTYVARVPFMTSGALYFFADLTPAPFPLDGDTMILNERAHRRVLDDMRAHPHLYEAFVGNSLNSPDATAFLEGHPNAARIDRQVNGETVHILLTDR